MYLYGAEGVSPEAVGNYDFFTGVLREKSHQGRPVPAPSAGVYSRIGRWALVGAWGLFYPPRGCAEQLPTTSGLLCSTADVALH